MIYVLLLCAVGFVIGEVKRRKNGREGGRGEGRKRREGRNRGEEGGRIRRWRRRKGK